MRDPYKATEEDGSSSRRGRLGEYVGSGRINLFLAKILKNSGLIEALPPEINVWMALLEVLLHEIGHHMQRADLAYREDGSVFGYEMSWTERDAREFAWREIHHLAALDPYLFAPRKAVELGWLGKPIWKKLADMRERVYASDGNWLVANQLRVARLHAIHVPKRQVVGSAFRPLTPGELRKLCKHLAPRYCYDAAGKKIMACRPVSGDFPDDNQRGWSVYDCWGTLYTYRPGRQRHAFIAHKRPVGFRVAPINSFDVDQFC